MKPTIFLSRVQYGDETPPRLKAIQNTQGDTDPEGKNIGVPTGTGMGQSSTAGGGALEPKLAVPSHESQEGPEPAPNGEVVARDPPREAYGTSGRLKGKARLGQRSKKIVY